MNYWCGRLLWIAIASLVATASFEAKASDESIRSILADGFDYPVGYPSGYGYYKARGFRPYPNGHLGEDWNGRGGGNTDLGDPVYACGHGVVVFSQDYKLGWGNVVIIRHAYRNSDGRIYFVDSLYGHLHERFVKLHETVRRGQKIGTIGTNKGMYYAHLHFEMRKNLNIGMKRTSYSMDYSNYYSPSQFIEQHRSIRKEFREHQIPVDNFSTGVANYVKGPALESVPRPPTDDEPPQPILDRELAKILAKRDLMKPEPEPQAVVEMDKPEIVGRERIEPSIGEERASDEREKIRTFWTKFREKLREGEVDNGPSYIPEQ